MPEVEIHREAIFSRDRRHRFELLRQWDETLPTLAVVMLNPSTADHTKDDQTILGVTGFARRWGFGSFRAVNLFSLITPYPDELFASYEPVRLPRNDRHIRRVAAEADALWFAWGNGGARFDHAARVEAMLSSFQPRCIGVTRRGAPAHPLYQKRTLRLKPYAPLGAGV